MKTNRIRTLVSLSAIIGLVITGLTVSPTLSASALGSVPELMVDKKTMLPGTLDDLMTDEYHVKTVRSTAPSADPVERTIIQEHKDDTTILPMDQPYNAIFGNFMGIANKGRILHWRSWNAGAVVYKVVPKTWFATSLVGTGEQFNGLNGTCMHHYDFHVSENGVDWVKVNDQMSFTMETEWLSQIHFFASYKAVIKIPENMKYYRITLAGFNQDVSESDMHWEAAPGGVINRTCCNYNSDDPYKHMGIGSSFASNYDLSNPKYALLKDVPDSEYSLPDFEMLPKIKDYLLKKDSEATNKTIIDLLNLQQKNLEFEGFDIIIQGGQSNCEGSGFGRTDSPFVQNPDILYLNDELSIYPAEEDRGSNLGLQFATDYIEEGLLKKGRKILMIRAAVGGTGFSSGDWRLDGKLYKQMLKMTDEALASLPGNHRTVAFLWHQGGFDVGTSNYDTHKSDLTNLINGVRERYNPDLPFFAGNLVKQWRDEHNDINAVNEIVNAMRDTCNQIGKAAFIETDDLLSNAQVIGGTDTIHYSRDSLYKLGRKYFQAFLEIKNTP